MAPCCVQLGTKGEDKMDILHTWNIPSFTWATSSAWSKFETNLELVNSVSQKSFSPPPHGGLAEPGDVSDVNKNETDRTEER